MFSDRINQTNIPNVKQLMQLMARKQSRLVVSADLVDAAAIIKLARAVGPFIVLLKLHADIIRDFSPQFVKTLQQIAKDQGFMLFEDRKIADIGFTATQQLTGGLHRIAQWADFVTVHALLGPPLIEALQPIAEASNVALLLLADLSVSGHLITDAYRKAACQMAVTYRDVVGGMITQTAPIDPVPTGCLLFTPGVHLHEKRDNMGQTYRDPKAILSSVGSDLIIVGRAIHQSDNPALSAKRYRDQFAFD
jgi:orotidine 5'-phosphate decarboxylase subfamily 1